MQAGRDLENILDELDLEARGWTAGVGPARPSTEQFCILRDRPRFNETDDGSGKFNENAGMSC